MGLSKSAEEVTEIVVTSFCLRLSSFNRPVEGKIDVRRRKFLSFMLSLKGVRKSFRTRAEVDPVRRFMS